MPRSDFSFAHPLRVRWAEVDPQGIVFNGNYLTYFDVGMTEYFRALGFPYPDGLAPFGADLFVVRSTIDYHAPALYDDELDILTRVGRLGRSSIRLLLEIHRGEEHLISGELVYVTADPETRKSMPVPSPIRKAIDEFEVMPPESN